MPTRIITRSRDLTQRDDGTGFHREAPEECRLITQMQMAWTNNHNEINEVNYV